MTKHELASIREKAHELLDKTVENKGKADIVLMCHLIDDIEVLTYYVEQSNGF